MVPVEGDCAPTSQQMHVNHVVLPPWNPIGASYPNIAGFAGWPVLQERHADAAGIAAGGHSSGNIHMQGLMAQQNNNEQKYRE
jgi:hypothetical protein